MIFSISNLALATFVAWVATTADADENSFKVTKNLDLTGNKHPSCGAYDLKACYIRDLSTQHEYPIDFQRTTYYKVDPYYMQHKGYSIRCDITPNVDYLNFRAQNYQKYEYKTPYWMAGDSYGKPAPVPYLKQCGRKYVSIQGYDKRKNVCFHKKFWIEAKCEKKECPYGQVYKNGLCVKKCPYGYIYKPQYGKCVKQHTICNYKCPQFSTYKRGYTCRGNIYDCECYKGYKMNIYNNKHYCKKIICGHGEVLQHGKCVRVYKNCTYQCPPYSKRLPNRDCYDTFDDCYCIHGYYKKGGKCVRSLKI